MYTFQSVSCQSPSKIYSRLMYCTSITAVMLHSLWLLHCHSHYNLLFTSITTVMLHSLSLLHCQSMSYDSSIKLMFINIFHFILAVIFTTLKLIFITTIYNFLYQTFSSLIGELNIFHINVYCHMTVTFVTNDTLRHKIHFHSIRDIITLQSLLPLLCHCAHKIYF